MNRDSDRELVIFTEAIKVAPQERAAFVKRMCGDNEDLCRKVEALLRAHDRMGNFLEEPPIGASNE